MMTGLFDTSRNPYVVSGLTKCIHDGEDPIELEIYSVIEDISSNLSFTY